MLTLLGRREAKSTTCDGVSRRGFLQIGALGFGGMELLRAEATAENRRSHKAVINILLPGGPPHQDMFDLKPAAPRSEEHTSELQSRRNPVCRLPPEKKTRSHWPMRGT